MITVAEQVEVCEAQELVFRVMKHASFNAFDGAVVVDSLRNNRHLWRGAIFGRFEDVKPFTLRPGETWQPACDYGIILRDIQDDFYNADTLLLTAPAGAEDALEALARTWHADEIDWENVPHAGRALRV